MYARRLSGMRAVVPTVRWGLIILFGLSLNACGGTPSKPTKAEEYGVLRAAGVVGVGTADDFKQYKVLHDTYAAAGVSEADMVDGATIAARTMCCRDNMKYSGPVVLYNPQHLKISPGDFVEFRIGGITTIEHKNELNVVTRVLQHGEPADGACWWEPRNPGLWRRLVYCDWMQKEGWVRDDSMGDPGWYKPVAAAQSP